MKKIFKEGMGLDRMIVSGFRIIDIKENMLKDKPNVVLDFESLDGAEYLLQDGRHFSKLKIDDNKKFSRLTAGRQKNKYGYYDYVSLSITVSDDLNGNLISLSVNEYKEKIQLIFVYLYEQYGVLVDDTDTKISSMEINCTLELSRPFTEYYRALNLMMFNLPNYYKKITKVQTGNKDKVALETETFYRGNTSMQIIIYDKKRQLEDCYSYHCDANIMRIEFVLKKTQKVKEVFGNNKLADLSDEKVCNYFIKTFRKIFENKFQSWKKDNAKKLKQMIFNHKERNRIYWQRNLLNECRNMEQKKGVPVLLDIEDLLEQIKRLDNTGHFKRIKEEILKKCEKDDVFLQNDTAKIEEIIFKVEEIYRTIRSQ